MSAAQDVCRSVRPRRATRPPAAGAPRWFASFAVAIGLSVLAGWAFDVEVLKCVFPGLISMKPNAALGFVLAGSSLWAVAGGRGPCRLALGLGVSAGVVGVLTLFEYATGLGLGIDQVLAREPAGAFGSLHPGRMHPTTAFDFTLIGAALALLAAGRGYREAQAMALVAATVAGSALLGYVYWVRVFVGLAAYGQMALHTALGMVALASGVLLVLTDRGLMSAIVSDSAGGQMARRLLPVAVLVPITLNGLILLGQESNALDLRLGAAVRVIVGVAVFAGFIAWNAHALDRLDRMRRRASDELRAAHDVLQARIAEQEQAEAGLRASERRYRFLADLMPQIVWTARPDGGPEYVNRRWTEYTGLSFEQTDQGAWTRVIHPDDRRASAERWAASLRSGEPFETEYRFRGEADGLYRWHLGRAEPLRDQDGRVVQWVGTCTDIHDQKRVQAELRAASEGLENRVRERTAELGRQVRLVDLAQDAIIVRSTAGLISSWNRGAENLFGWTRAEAVGRRTHDLLGTRFPKPLAEIEAALAADGGWAGELTHTRRDGGTVVVVSRWVLDRATGEDGPVLEINSDVTERNAAEAALRKAKEVAEAATLAKSEFLANMSHEIRTPMNGILGMTDLALETDLTARQREYLGLVKSSADALLTVINDILDFSKIEAGKLELSPHPFRLRDVVEETVRTLAPRAHAKGLELACRVAPGVPDAVVGDAGRLRQVVVNLLGNAIKFTDRGEIVVQAEARDGGDGDGDGPGFELQVSVADTGIGIPGGKLASIFEPFEQTDNSTTRRFGGTGLGLAISGRLVALMGGRIRVESRVGVGSTFHFTARLGRQPGLAADPAPGGGSLDGARVLVVDDNATNRRIVVEVLKTWGADPTAVDGGPAALDAIRAEAAAGRPFAAAVLDMMMPGMDGRELAARIRAEADAPRIALVLMSSDGVSGNGTLPGFDACLPKPLRRSELFDALSAAIGAGPGSVPETRAAGEVAGNADTAPAAPARPGQRVLLAEDHPVNQKLAARILEGAGHVVTIVGDGHRAVEALLAGEFDVVVMDVQMPVMDGFEALACVRALADPFKRDVPVIALTAHAMKGDRERCLAAGFDGYLAKPVRADALRDAVDRLSRPPAPVAVGDDGDGNGRAVSVVDELVGRYEGGDAFVRELLGSFLESAALSSAAIASAALEAEPSRLGSEAHGLKGACLCVGADDLAAACTRLEAAARGDDPAARGDASRAVLSGLSALSAAIASYLNPA